MSVLKWHEGQWQCHAATEEQKKKEIRSDITPDPGGHRPQRPCAHTYAKQDQPQASSPGQNRTQRRGGATTHGLRTMQAGKSAPTETRPGNGECIPQSTPQEGTLQQDPNTSASCAKGTYGRGQLQGRAGTGQHKPWQQQRGHDRPETPPVTQRTIYRSACFGEFRLTLILMASPKNCS